MLTITIPLPGLSLNNSHMALKRGGRIKCQATRNYEEIFSLCLVKYHKELREFFDHLDCDANAIAADYSFFFPVSQYFTKKWRLNLSKLPDADNLIKITQDLIFKEFYNDAHVVKVSSVKLPTKGKPYIKATLKIVDLPKQIDEGINGSVEYSTQV